MALQNAVDADIDDGHVQIEAGHVKAWDDLQQVANGYPDPRVEAGNKYGGEEANYGADPAQAQ